MKCHSKLNYRIVIKLPLPKSIVSLLSEPFIHRNVESRNFQCAYFRLSCWTRILFELSDEPHKCASADARERSKQAFEHSLTIKIYKLEQIQKNSQEIRQN